jgi:hypothetical protein
MSYARQMLDTYANDFAFGAHKDVLAEAIDASSDCAQACRTDNDADLTEQHLADMVTCIRLCQNCADICAAVASVLSRPYNWDVRVVQPLVEACAASCESCAAECERHAPEHAHCLVCGQACRRCEQACNELLRILR